MFTAVLWLHSWLRWLVLAILIARGARGVQGWLQGADYGPLDKRLSLGAMILVDLQLLLGLILFAVSPTIQGALADPGAAMKNSAVRLLFVEHPFTMIVGVVLVHIGYALAKRGTVDAKRHRNAGLLTLAALLVILARIPW
jgi:hypothetical protein